MDKIASIWLKKAAEWWQSYQSPEPLHLFLKRQFIANKNMGSTDRKIMSDLLYAFCRAKHQFQEFELEDGILESFKLSVSHGAGIVSESVLLKFGILPKGENASMELHFEALFPYFDSFSNSLDKVLLLDSWYNKPLVWMNVRPDFFKKVYETLEFEGLDPVLHEKLPFAIGLVKADGLDKVKSLNSAHYIIQDSSAQLIIQNLEVKQGMKIWDVCAGAGGKSLGLKFQENSIKLQCTDIRTNILENLKNRFKLFGFAMPETYAIDMSQTGLITKPFELVIADVPCTGSGTWRRTPEAYASFNFDSINEYVILQRKIISNVVANMDKGSKLVYATCSIFEAENEGNANWISNELGMELIELEMYQSVQSDFMFRSILIKS